MSWRLFFHSCTINNICLNIVIIRAGQLRRKIFLETMEIIFGPFFIKKSNIVNGFNFFKCEISTFGINTHENLSFFGTKNLV